MKKKYYTFILLLPSILVNYLTLTILDVDHNLSFTSTLIVTLFNILNIFFIIFLNKINFKKLLTILTSIIVLIIFFDFSFQNYKKRDSYQIQDKELGWILNKSIKKKFETKSKKNRKYTIDYTSSDELGFRSYETKKKFDKTILILGDSFTVGPYASDDQMYSSEIKKIFKKNNLNYNWFVMGSAGWGTLQQYMYLEKKINDIKPDILIHQFCDNDFLNNSMKIEENTYLRSQYIFRPFLVDKKIEYKNNLFYKIYRFLYSNSFVFKTVDNLITNKQYQKNKSYFKKSYSKKEYEEAIKITDYLIKKIKKLIGDNNLYFIVNCYNKQNIVNDSLNNISKNNNLYYLKTPIIELKKADDRKEDIFNFDGGHLNDIGNKIYGTAIGNEILKIIK